MKGLFEQEEIKKFTFEDKLRWVLRSIINSCNPKETGKQRINYYDLNSQKYRNLTFPICEFTEPKSLPESRFNDLQFWVENEVCFIEFQNGKYQFHLSQLLRVNKGLLKAIK